MSSEKKICAIHQPNFFPWLGYFDKISKADAFIFLDKVSYPKSSKTMSSWTNRVAINIQNNKQWISVPVIREEGIQLIDDVLIDNSSEWRKKLKKTIKYNYSKAKYFGEIESLVFGWIDLDCQYLADYNIRIISEISEIIGLETEFIRQRDICTTHHSTKLLIEIAKKVGCNSYLCGGGAGGYQNDSLFSASGIELIYQNYDHPQYKQISGCFMEGLSVLDALFNLGIAGTGSLFK